MMPVSATVTNELNIRLCRVCTSSVVPNNTCSGDSGQGTWLALDSVTCYLTVTPAASAMTALTGDTTYDEV